MDCERWVCDSEFLRQEITYINYVIDRKDAQVHVLVTTEQTGGGGRAFTMDFVGLQEFSGADHQLTYFSTPDDTDDDERRGFAKILQLGLMRYAAQTPLAERLTISEQRPAGRVQLSAQPEEDPWKFWVFRARVNTRIEAETSQSERSFSGSFSGNRTTENWKINLGMNVSYNEDRYTLSDGSRYTNFRRNSSVTGRVVKSLGEHWGFGFGGSAVATTYRNQDLTLHMAPAIEYNFFPYSESTRRQFTIAYSAGLSSFDYEELSIFDKMAETRVSQSLIVSFERNEPWGETEVTVESAQFLDNLSQQRAVVFGRLDLRLFRGFFLNLRGDTSLVRDQVYLPRRGVSDEEILVRRRQLATDYEYSFRVGITYSFGSIYNNVVNSRFAGSSGGFIRAF